MDTKNFKVFQRRTDRIHLSYSFWSALIMFNGIIIAIATFTRNSLCSNNIPRIIIFSLASIALLVINFFTLRWQIDNKIDTLLNKSKIGNDISVQDVSKKNKQTKCYKYIKENFTTIIEIFSLLFCILALYYIIKPFF